MPFFIPFLAIKRGVPSGAVGGKGDGAHAKEHALDVADAEERRRGKSGGRGDARDHGGEDGAALADDHVVLRVGRAEADAEPDPHHEADARGGVLALL